MVLLTRESRSPPVFVKAHQFILMSFFCAINSDITTRIEHRLKNKENRRKRIDNRRIANRRQVEDKE